MSCAKPKCRTKADDPMIGCWLCNAIYHAKCVDLAPRTADNLREDKGLRWCCKKCMVYDIEFFSFFKNTRVELDDINNDLKCLTTKFLKYKELLEKAPFSPKRKKSTAAVNSQISLNNCNTADNIDDNVSNYTEYLTPSTSIQRNSPIVQSLLTEKTNTTISSDPSSSSNNTSKPLTSQRSQPSLSNTSLPQKQVSPIILNADVPDFMPVNNPVTLKIISPKKTIFAARFASETTTDDVAEYIKQKLGYEIDITVFKFKYSEHRSKSSFKIIVPEDNFDTIVNNDFWPPKAIIHEYIYRNDSRSDIVYLPAQNNVSKN